MLIHESAQRMNTMDPCELTASVTAIANVISCRLNDNDIALLSAILVQLGDTLAAIAAQRALNSAVCQKNDKAFGRTGN